MIPRRLPMPPDEDLYNRANYEQFENLTLWDPVWWDVN